MNTIRQWFLSLIRDPKIDRSVEVKLQTEEAKEALHNALSALKELEGQEIEARAISISLRERREKNHFGYLLLYAMSRKNPKKT